MTTIFCDNCSREILDFVYPVRMYIVKFDFCKECFIMNLDALLKNRVIMKSIENISIVRGRKQGKEVLN